MIFSICYAELGMLIFCLYKYPTVTFLLILIYRAFYHMSCKDNKNLPTPKITKQKK